MIRHTSALCMLLACILLVACGLDEHTKKMAEKAISSKKANMAEVEEMISSVESQLATDEYASVRDAWSQQIATARNNLQAYSAAIDKAAGMVEKDDNDYRGSIMQALSNGAKKRFAARNELVALQEMVTLIGELKKDKSALVSKAKSSLAGVSTAAMTQVRSDVDAAVAEFPNKQKPLQARITRLEGYVAEAETLAAQMDGTDLPLVATAIKRSRALPNDFSSEINTTRSLCKQLYTSWTQTLTDMNILDTGNKVQFQHEYLYVRTDTSGNVTQDKKWQNVSEQVFEANEKNMGMAIAQKPRGKFDNEVVRTAQPPGYSYMARPGHDNQYGHWRTDSSGNSFWEFYGQYAFMRDVFWGPSYRPIYVDDYRGYRRSYDSGRPYYGTSNGKPRYGTTGTSTSQKYSRSKYRTSPTVKSYKTYRSSGGSSKRGGGFSNSRYSTTGTKRIQARAAASRSSGSRSSGGK